MVFKIWDETWFYSLIGQMWHRFELIVSDNWRKLLIPNFYFLKQSSHTLFDILWAIPHQYNSSLPFFVFNWINQQLLVIKMCCTIKFKLMKEHWFERFG